MSHQEGDDESLDLDDAVAIENTDNGIVSEHELSVRDVCDISASLPEEEKLEEEVLERSQGSLNRYYELSSFRSRSSRKLSCKNLSCNEDDVLALTERTVKVPLNDSPEARQGRLMFYEQEPISAAEALNYFMQPDDYLRCDTDVKTTIVLWLKNKKGRGEFDEDVNTVRGLEELFDALKHRNDNKGRNDAKRQHVKLVIEEVNRQRLNDIKQLDSEKIRTVSLKSSEEATRRAINMGKRDAAEAIRVNSPPPSKAVSPHFTSVQSMPLPDSSAISMAGRRGLLGVALPAAKVNEKNKSRKGIGFLGFLQKKKSAKT